MGIINETNSEYYSGEQIILSDATTAIDFIISNFDVELFDTGTNNPPTLSNYEIYVATQTVAPFTWGLLSESEYSVSSGKISFDQTPPFTPGAIKLKLKQTNYGSYSYISLDDIINNFMIGYVGYEKTISRVNKTDVMFHAKRGLQEFSYDLLKVVKSQELTIPNSLCLPMPQDYVNYVRLSWVDDNGGKHIIYPTRVTSNPTELPLQDGDGVAMQDYLGDNLESQNSITDDRWANQSLSTNAQNVWQYGANNGALGKRYGLDPEEAQINGKFTINERTGKFCFTSDLVDKVIILEYVSDGLAYDSDIKVPKLAEEAVYMHIAHAILATRKNTPEYIINRYKRERTAAYRNAKIRLSNIKIGEISQVMRNKSKWIKH